MVRPTWTGQPLQRREDLRFLRGRGEYVDDRPFPAGLHVVPVRSPHAHARIDRIQTAAALAMPGVAGVVTGADIRDKIRPAGSPLAPPFDAVWCYPLAVDRARYVGEPVAVVLAVDRYVGEDAAAALEVDYEPLPAVIDADAALAPGAPRVHETVPSNGVWERSFVYGNPDAALAAADRVVRRRLHLHRFSSTPLETCAAAVEYNPRTGVYAVLSNLQVPERFRNAIAVALQIAPDRLHLECPDIGGGFGIKTHVQWVILLCWLAARFARPVKWVEDRLEHLLASHHGNEVWYDAELAVQGDGTVTGLSARAVHDEGAYLEREPKGAVNQLRHATGLYRFRNLRMDFRATLTNKCPTGPNRSYGKVQQTFLVERMMDEAARELGMDPVTFRLHNLVPPEAMPYETPAGALHDGGDYPRAVARAAEVFGYQEFRARQAEARRQGRYLGCGIACGIEASPSSASIQQLLNPADVRSGDSEAARIRIEEDGRIWVAVGTVSQGHGHETVAAQVVADQLGVKPDDVVVTTGYDSWRDPHTPHSGTHASRFAVMAGGALVGAAGRLREKIVRLAAHVLAADPGTLVLRGGAAVEPATGRSVSLAALAHLANHDLARLPADLEPGLEAIYVYHPPLGPATAEGRGNFSLTYAYSATMVSLEVDIETGRIRLHRIVCVDDCGRRLNPLVVAGQIHGALAHQVGAALFERFQYDDAGQLLTANFNDYALPTAADLPSFEVEHLEVPSLFAPLGVRGGGEGAGTALVAALNAVVDALSPFGVRLVEGNVGPGDVWSLLRQAEATRQGTERGTGDVLSQ